MTTSFRLRKILTTAGIVILAACIVSRAFIAFAPFDTGRRGAAFGALSAAISLDLLWIVLAAPTALFQRRERAPVFWMVLIANGLIALLAVADIFGYRIVLGSSLNGAFASWHDR